MSIIIKESYNLDILNFLNVITGVDFYTKHHTAAYLKFKDLMSDEGRKYAKALAEKTKGMISPYLTLVISSVEGFENVVLAELLENQELLKSSFSKYSYFNPDNWENKRDMLKPTAHLIRELEANGFKDYWIKERLPLIKEKQTELDVFMKEYNIQKELEVLLGKGIKDNSITLYLCSFASPHGIKLCNPSYISDVAYSKETTLRIAIHEMFHPPYNRDRLKKELEALAEDSLIKEAFENQNPQFGYSTIQGFIEENVVEAMELYVSEKAGLIKDPLAYLDKHDEGSHVFSVVLLKYLKEQPKPIDETFENYFKVLLKGMTIGNLTEEFKIIKSK